MARPGRRRNGPTIRRHPNDDRASSRSTTPPGEDSEPVRARNNADLPGGYSEWAGVGSGGREDGDYNLEAFVSAETTLADWLREQLALAIADPARRMIGQYLIDLVDEAGYLAGDLAAAAEKLGTSTAEVEAVLGILQTFDPPGVFARDLAECLAIQLRGARSLRSRHAGAGRAARSPGAARFCRAEKDMRRRRRGSGRHDRGNPQLNPKPGLAFGSAPVQPIVPDVFVRPAPDGAWLVELNSDTLPKVWSIRDITREVSAEHAPRHRKILSRRVPAERHLAGARARPARPHHPQGLERNRPPAGRVLCPRRRTTRPLNLKTVAEAIGMHELTVSRVTANKYMATSRGIFEMKYFFTSAIAAATAARRIPPKRSAIASNN